jgi:hypothetical protein
MRWTIYIFTAVLLGSSFATLSAEEQKGIVNEFRAVEEAIRKRDQDPKILEQNLHSNLIRAMEASITRRFFHTREKYLADLKIENLNFEKFEGTNTYYVKYKAFIVRFDFMRDPERFIQAPVYEKFLILDDQFDQDHDTQPATP